MERFKVLEGIRKQVFPLSWNATVAKQYPSIHEILTSMLSHVPEQRPSAKDVTNHIESLLGEYTVLSLDLDNTATCEGAIFLRVEAEDNEGVLARTIKLIKEATSGVTIIQYSLRGQESKAIMEFALGKTAAGADSEGEGDYEDEGKSEEQSIDTQPDPEPEPEPTLRRSSRVRTKPKWFSKEHEKYYGKTKIIPSFFCHLSKIFG